MKRSDIIAIISLLIALISILISTIISLNALKISEEATEEQVVLKKEFDEFKADIGDFKFVHNLIKIENIKILGKSGII